MAKKPLSVEALTHDAATRRNIPTAEYESVMREQDKAPVRLAYERRNRDLDPQLVWRGKDEQDWSDLVVQAPPLFIQEKVHPKVIIDDLKRATAKRAAATEPAPDLFADFNGLSGTAKATDFYRHDQHWSNRMIVGDSLSVMASLAEREGLRGKVQCIYLDPPYGIKFNSNFQWSTTSRDVKDGAKDHITREPEQVRAFRDTWRHGIHSYLTYLRDRLTVARDLLHESGSIFVQIGEENMNRVALVMDEVFGEHNRVVQISFVTANPQTGLMLEDNADHIVWYARDKSKAKYRTPYLPKTALKGGAAAYRFLRFPDLSVRTKNRDESLSNLPSGAELFRGDKLTSSHPPGSYPVPHRGREWLPGKGFWSTGEAGMLRLSKSDRLIGIGNTLSYVRFINDFPAIPIGSIWTDTTTAGFASDKTYVVQTNPSVVQRCILMTTDPGDLVLDPTCGSGTTAYVAEQWGRRWITIDTSRVAVALARSRLMGARYPWYLLADSPEGQRKEADVTGSMPKSAPTRGDIRHGFVYERARSGTSGAIANNAEIDVIWDKWQAVLEPLRAGLNAALRREPAEGKGDRPPAGQAAPAEAPAKPAAVSAKEWEEWEIPREAGATWLEAAKDAHAKWWEARIARQKEIDASIAAKADSEYLYDKPYTDTARVRVAGPFTVESVSPHRTLAVDWNDELIEMSGRKGGLHETGPGVPTDDAGPERDFAQMILDNLKAAGVQQAAKEDRISFTSLTGWPGNYICAEGTYVESDSAEGGKRDRAPAAQAAPNALHIQDRAGSILGEASAEPTAASAKVRRAGIFIGPEFGTVSRPDLVAAAREAGDAGFDVLIACAFNYDAHSSEFERLGRVPVLKARMNPDLHMGTFLTVDTCHFPPRAVRTPRWFKAVAIPPRLVIPVAWI